MKRLLFLCCFAALVLSSCVTYHWQLGQSLSEFGKMNAKGVRQLILVKESQALTVYRTPDNGQELPYYFWFVNGTLNEVNRGGRVPDIVIQHQY